MYVLYSSKINNKFGNKQSPVINIARIGRLLFTHYTDDGLLQPFSGAKSAMLRLSDIHLTAEVQCAPLQPVLKYFPHISPFSGTSRIKNRFKLLKMVTRAHIQQTGIDDKNRNITSLTSVVRFIQKNQLATNQKYMVFYVGSSTQTYSCLRPVTFFIYLSVFPICLSAEGKFIVIANASKSTFYQQCTEVSCLCVSHYKFSQHPCC